MSNTANNVKNAQDTVIYGLSGTVNPTIFPVEASIGTTYKFLLSPPRYYQKQDEGTTTNWKDVTLDYTFVQVGTGEQIIKSVDNNTRTVEVRTLKAGSNVTITQNPYDLTISASGGGSTVLPIRQTIVLTPTDILNQYVDLSYEYVTDSVFIGVNNRVNLYEGLDFSCSVVGGVTRITFEGPSASGGGEPLSSDQTLFIKGLKA